MKRHVHVMALAFLGVRVVPGPVVDGLVLAVVLALVMVIVRAVVKHLVCMNAIRLADQHAWVIVRVHAKEGALMDVLALVLEHVLVLPMLCITVQTVTQFVHLLARMAAKNHVLAAVKLDVIRHAKEHAMRYAKTHALQVAKLIVKEDAKVTVKVDALAHAKHHVRVVVKGNVLEIVEEHAGASCSIIHSSSQSKDELWKNCLKHKMSSGSLAWQRALRLLSPRTAS